MTDMNITTTQFTVSILRILFFVPCFMVFSLVHAEGTTTVPDTILSEPLETVPSARMPDNMPRNPNEYPRNTLDIRVQERIMNLSENIRTRIRATIRRMEGIAIRLESRMNKLEQEGYNTTQSRALIAQVYAQQKETAMHLTQLDALPTLISSDTPRTSYATIREEFIRAQDSLRQTHQLLRSTIKEMRSLTTQSSVPTTATTTEGN